MATLRPSIADLVAQLQKKSLSSVELVQESLKQAKLSSKLGKVFLSIRDNTALQDAQASDARRAAGKTLSPLDGIPVAIKDNIVMKDEPCTCASKILANYNSPYDSHVVEQLKKAGAVIVGRTNLDEFAMGSSNENSAFGTLQNPWDKTRVPGGSSGGSAAAVAAGIVPLSLGSDTGGSVRLPASFCGTVGLKPSYGRVSRYGLVAFASSLDQIGPCSWWVEDSAMILATIAGFDRRDSTSTPASLAQPLELQSLSKQLREKISGLKIGIPAEYVTDDLSAEVRESFEAAVQQLEKLGAKRVAVSLPHTKYAVGCYYIIASAEASANLSRFDGIRYGYRASDGESLKDLYINSRSQGFGAEVQRRIMLGTFVLSSGYYDAYYIKGQKVRTLLRRDFLEAYKKCDVIVTPTAPFAAFKVGEKVADPLQMYLSDIFTTSTNLAGLPAVSVPCGFSQEGLPLGLQLIGKDFAEAQLLQIAYQYEQSTPWKERTPKWQ